MSLPPTPRPGSGPGENAIPTCFRHPDRETYVRCTRCERPICPDCMRDAAVGFHCVECVAEGQKSVRQARTAFGGKVVQGPYVTWALLALIGVVFLAQTANSQLTVDFGMHGGAAMAAGEWYRLITAAFLHGNVMHLLFNGFALYVIGQQLESWLGHVRYLSLWVLSAIGGSVLTLLAEPTQLSVGASGAIFGLFGAVFVIGRRLGLDTRAIVGLLAVNLLITFLVPNISWTGHIGGLVTGLALAGVYAYLPWGSGKNRTAVHAAATGACALVLAALAYGGMVFWMG
ncbi:rhomboid family intramembrane serine protease [Nocardiopsis gilva YIM 90087]|uniref:Rhomboid family intramembrane serine protease n=1 Tax=Nocardiopsis gilva YIM 90087 TaxID=1235441 RepID=A0A223S118_9ACTN|nr:rhomboid family intramembrane serine protease [Nocardiopsis gilva]ASU81804.1 rhomboid family intramembrane serine protease [Nocardiopsis gilva YIM 90087]